MGYGWRASSKQQAPQADSPTASSGFGATEVTERKASPQPAYNSPQPSAPQAPSKAPDMSAYNIRTPPQGAKMNDLSGQVPSNQIWGQAYNQASNQYGGNTQARSWTMPGSYSSQSFNPATGKASEPTGGESWDGNMAYYAIDQRPGPIQASAVGVGGDQMPWQDSLAQREAFVGNLSQRLGQYSGGQVSGPVTFDSAQLLGQANDQLSNGTFYNPFSQQNPEVQKAISGAGQYATGTQWQNPFGQQASIETPAWGVGGQPPVRNFSEQAPASQQTISKPAAYQEESPRPSPMFFDPYGRSDNPQAWLFSPAGRAQPKQTPSTGTPYNPQAERQALPPPPSREVSIQPTASAASDAPVVNAQDSQQAQRNAQVARIDSELNKWKAATYGTRTGSGPPAAWTAQVASLQKLRARAAAGDPSALAWTPTAKAPPPNVSRAGKGSSNRILR